MILVLTNGERVLINRMNCGHQQGNEATGSRNWNINPLEMVEKKQPGFFVIADYGSRVHSSAVKMIPISSVVQIEYPDEWEKKDIHHGGEIRYDSLKDHTIIKRVVRCVVNMEKVLNNLLDGHIPTCLKKRTALYNMQAHARWLRRIFDE